jgi:hypothetical protein
MARYCSTCGAVQRSAAATQVRLYRTGFVYSDVLRHREVLGLNFGRDTDRPDRDLSCFFFFVPLSHSKEMQKSFPSKYLTNHSNIRRYILPLLKASINNAGKLIDEWASIDSDFRACVN